MKTERTKSLNARQALVLMIVGRQTKSGCPVAARDVVDIAWNNGRGLTYDQTNRVLRQLVEGGWLWKPTRGNYLLVEARDAE